MLRESHLKKIINKQFKIAKVDLRYDDIKDGKIPRWYQDYTCSTEERTKWIDWTRQYLRKNVKFTKDKAIVEAAWLDLQYGLKER